MRGFRIFQGLQAARWPNPNHTLTGNAELELGYGRRIYRWAVLYPRLRDRDTHLVCTVELVEIRITRLGERRNDVGCQVPEVRGHGGLITSLSPSS
jgi:hypothetical protein